MWRFPGSGVTRICIDVEHFETGSTDLMKNTLRPFSEFRAKSAGARLCRCRLGQERAYCKDSQELCCNFKLVPYFEPVTACDKRVLACLH